MPLTLSDFREIDEHLFQGWPPARIVNFRNWLCALDGGVTRRPNSVWPIAWDEHASLETAIDEAEGLYRAANLRPCFRISDGAIPANLDAQLAKRGYDVEGRSHVLAAPSTMSLPSNSNNVSVTLIDNPNADWLACYESGLATEVERRIVRAIFRRLECKHVFGAAVEARTVVCVMLAVLSGQWVQISAVRTLSEYRRKGLAALVMATVSVWASREGATRLVLQVDATNAPALALYRRAGFHRIYGYHYRVKA